MIMKQSIARNKNFCKRFINEKPIKDPEIKKKIKDNIEKDIQKITSFRYAHFQIPLYRIPVVSLLTISLPIWILGWVSLAIFFQDFELSNRISSIATIMVAYTQFLSIVRGELPPTPKITFIEVLINASIIINIFCLIESVSMRESKNEFQVTAFFIIALIFQLFYMFIVVGLIICYYTLWKPSYDINSGVDWLLNPF